MDPETKQLGRLVPSWSKYHMPEFIGGGFGHWCPMRQRKKQQIFALKWFFSCFVVILIKYRTTFTRTDYHVLGNVKWRFTTHV